MAFIVIENYCKGAVIQISTVFQPIYYVTCRRVLLNRTFYTFIFPRFSDSASLKIHQLWVSSFLQKCSKLNLDFIKDTQKLRKKFSLWDNCIWICCKKLSLLRREDLSSAIKGLTNNSKIFNITKRDLFQLNCFHCDQKLC